MDFDLAGIQLLIFDFDGVIARKSPSQYPIALFSEFLKDDSKLQAGEFVSFSGTDWIAELERLGVDTTDADILAEISRRMFEYGKDGVCLYEWVRQRIPELAKVKKLAILTNNGMATVRQALDGFEMYFSSIKTWENVSRLKPAPDGILCICQELGVSPSETLMIGDSIEDTMAATAAITRSLTVNNGECPQLLFTP